MKPLLSPLILKDFAITENKFTFTSVNEGINDLEELFNSYPIDIDFGYSENDLYITISVKVQVNNADNPDILGGYSIIAEGTSIFEFNNKVKLSNDERASLLNYSGLSITINHVRGFIAALTSYAPFGRYNLPTIDVNSLLSKKKDQLNCDRSSKNEIDK